MKRGSRFGLLGVASLVACLAFVLGCEEAPKPKPAPVVVAAAPPPPPPVLPPPAAVVFVDEPIAVVGLRSGFSPPVPPVSAAPWQSFLQLAEVFLPVVDADGGLIGIVSIGDLVKHRIAAAEAEAAAMQAYIAAH